MKKARILTLIVMLLAFAGAFSIGAATAPKAHAAGCSGSYYEVDGLATKSIYDSGRHTTVTATLEGQFDDYSNILCLASAQYEVYVDPGYSPNVGTVAGWICVSSSWTNCGGTVQSGSYGSFYGGVMCGGCGAGTFTPWVSVRSGSVYAVAEDGVNTGSTYWAAAGPY